MYLESEIQHRRRSPVSSKESWLASHEAKHNQCSRTETIQIFGIFRGLHSWMLWLFWRLQMESNLVDQMPITEQVFPRYWPKTNHPHVLFQGLALAWAEFTISWRNSTAWKLWLCPKNPILPLAPSTNVSQHANTSMPLLLHLHYGVLRVLCRRSTPDFWTE